jgi:3-hydroxyacyl-CoA dehydrogenase/enoyl-CoA hydratase/3-hydroxybutyryl-CoA epimerase
MSNVKVETGSDGIAVIALDAPGASMNVLSPSAVLEMSQALDGFVSRNDVQGILIVSAKQTFAAGWDLNELLGMLDAKLSAHDAFERSRQYSQFLRRLETCGKPVAAAINGLALGGGLELALAAHYRVLSSDPKAVVGLPEVKVGLLPGAGGTQRLARLIGIEKALPLLLEGKSIAPQQALELGIVHELAPADQVVERARQWLAKAHQEIMQARAAAHAAPPSKGGKASAPVLPSQTPWDRKGFRVPGGSSMSSPGFSIGFMAGTALVAKNTLHNFPAPPAILSAVFEGLQLPMDRALAVESKYFARLVSDTTARNLVRTLFVNKGKAEKLARRPADVAKSTVTKLGILGAGMMGAGIAHVSASAGMECILLDSTPEQAERGRQHVADLLAKEVEKGTTTREKADAVLARIKPTIQYADLAGCELVIEAVFEQRDVKANVTKQAEAVIPASAVFASNTSTLPITGLASASGRPAQFIGIHFFSPVHRMPLVEIIMGKKTSAATLARALDYVGQLRKTPIVVNDSRGFYTSRVFGTYCYEGQRMLEEGVSPALIENAGRFAGMPVGPLAVTDEVSLELQYKVIRQSQTDLGAKYHDPVGWNVLRHFVEDLQRLGRKSGGGFYEYPAGGRKFLWPGLTREYPQLEKQPGLDEVKMRLLFIQALETARCFEEGVLTSAAEADLGSVLGWGFPAFTGGTLSFIDTLGAAAFVAGCQQLAKRHGPRFKPTRALIERAKSGERFHPRAPWPQGALPIPKQA